MDLAKEGKSRITEDWLFHIVVEFFIAGSDTTTLTFQWLLLFMVKYPDVQKKVHEEIDLVLGVGEKSRKVSLSDRSKMTYIEAVILETMRHSPIAPFSISHSTTEDVEVGGYLIPNDTTVCTHTHTHIILSRDTYFSSIYISISL